MSPHLQGNPECAADPFDRIVTLLTDVRPTSKGVRARCPVHDDHTPSLDVDRAEDGKVLITCRSAGCSTTSIVKELGLSMRDLFPPRAGDHQVKGPDSHRKSRSPKRHADLSAVEKVAHWSATDGGKQQPGKVTRYDYTNQEGHVVGGMVRIDFADGRPKAIRRFRRDCDGWVLKDMEAQKPLYRLYELVQADLGETVFFVEGEKCVETVFELRLIGTTSAGGAQQPLDKTDFSPLSGRDVVILPDADPSGRQYAEGVAGMARRAGAARIRELNLPGLPDGGDIYDWVQVQRQRGLATAQIAEELQHLLKVAVDVRSPDPPCTGQHEATESELGLIALGEVDPRTGRLVLSPKKTLPTAHAFLRLFYTHDSNRTLLDYAGLLWVWSGNRYLEVEERRLEQELHPWLHEALRYAVNRKSGLLELVDFESNPGTVSSALKTVRAAAYLKFTTPVPSWLGGDAPQYPLSELLPCKSRTLHVPTQTLLPPSPKLFTFNAIDFDYDATAPEPHRWFKFLNEVFGDDIESVQLLQEWFGYCLLQDTSQQKILLMVGPRRSGKGTIARVQRELVGGGNVVGPTVGSLTGTFGLQPLLGRSLAIVSDARFSGDGIAILVERLLCISGEDTVTVDRKFLTSVTMKLPVRFMFLTNELPRFNDSSTALAGRFVVLRLTKSFYGKEDVNLTNTLLAELPGILLWALIGWQRLRDRGRFQEPESSRAAVQDIEDLSSPVNAFVRERCVVDAGRRVSCAELYQAWISWCNADGRTSHTTAQVFGRDLAAAAPGVVRRRCSGRPHFYEGIGLNPGEMP